VIFPEFPNMKRVLLTIPLVASLFSASQNRFPQFILAFGNDFHNDSVTIIMDQKTVTNNIQLRRTMIDPENLMVEQNKSSLEVRPYNQPTIKLSRISIIDSILPLKIQLNNIWYNFALDLRKGTALIAHYVYYRVGWSMIKLLRIRQTEGILML
jgi:hypothetical protein